MCRIIFTYKKQNPTYFRTHILDEFQDYYMRYCKTDKLSYGVVGFETTDRNDKNNNNNNTFIENRGTGMPKCDSFELSCMPTKYAMYHVRYKNGPGPSTIENTHPMMNHNDRYVFMHNGRIKCLDTPGRTDSQVFFDHILYQYTHTRPQTHTHIHTQTHTYTQSTLRDALERTIALLKQPLINVVLCDRHTGEFIVYHHGGNVPSLFWDSRRGIVTNWHSPHSKQIRLLWRPSCGKKIQHINI